MIGNIFVGLIAVASLAMIFTADNYKISKYVAATQLIFVVFTCVYLLWAIFANQFGVAYVYENVSKSMPLIYRLSAFWAGKGGSLLLWLLFSSAIGTVLFFRIGIPRVSIKILHIVQIVIALCVYGSNTFGAVSPIPADGLGMNVLLESPWMISHPPVIFLSYALLAVPFALTIAYLLKPGIEHHQQWLKNSLKWILSSWFFLTLGIVIGAVWAYQTLGWGGYWGWDSVENASLIPWLFLSVALHALLVDEYQTGNARPSVGGILASFCAMFVAVFIARSGAMSAISVHSFAGSNLFWPLLIATVASISFSIFAFVRAYKFIPHNLESTLTSRVFTIGFGNVALTVFASVVAVATLLPLVTDLLGHVLVASQTFYQTVTIPISAILCAGCCLAPIQAWKTTNLKYLVSQLIWPLFFALLFIVILAEIQMANTLMIALGSLAVVMVVANFTTMLKVKPARWGAFIAHIGVGIMTIGILASSIFQGSSDAILRLGQKPVESLGFSASFLSLEQTDTTYKAYCQLEYNDKLYLGTIKGKMWNDEWTSQPLIFSSFLRDVIIAPESFKAGIEFNLVPGVKTTISGYTLTLGEFMEDKAQLELEYDKEKLELTASSIDTTGNLITSDIPGMTIIVGKMADSTYRAYLIDMRSDTKGSATLVVKIYVRYWIFFVWFGMLIMLLGILWAYLRRRLNNHPKSPVIVTPNVKAALQ
jgi:cytochrome c-type biogenesis protein CcmF